MILASCLNNEDASVGSDLNQADGRGRNAEADASAFSIFPHLSATAVVRLRRSCRFDNDVLNLQQIGSIK